QISRIAINRRADVINIVSETAMPYADARLSDLPNPIVRPTVTIIKSQLTTPTYICPYPSAEVCVICNLGSQPSWIACRVIENAPVMIDWLAMTVATVASTTRGMSSAEGQSLKKM